MKISHYATSGSNRNVSAKPLLAMRYAAFAPILALLLLTTSGVAMAQNKYADGLRKMDRDKNGFLEPSEIPEFLRKNIHSLAERAKLDIRQPLPLATLLPLVGGKVEDKKDSRGRFNSSKPENEVPGFGQPPELPPPPAFDVPADSPLASNLPLSERYEEKVIKYVDDMLRRYDSNKNSVLERDEWKNVRWRNPPEESDLNKDGRLTKAELCERIAKRWDGYKKKDSSTSGSSRLGSSSSKSSSDSSDKVRRYAEGLIKQYDKNKNGVLDKDEWDRLRDRYGKADTNRDGALTLAEVTVHISNYSKSSSSSSSGSSSSSRYSSKSRGSSSSRDSSSRYSRSYSRRGSDSKKEEDPKTYRFKTAAERLPKGLPSWWEKSDADQDGQIKMSEFTSSWTYDKVEEFKQYDPNRDGVITPSEYFDWKALQRK